MARLHYCILSFIYISCLLHLVSSLPANSEVSEVNDISIDEGNTEENVVVSNYTLASEEEDHSNANDGAILEEEVGDGGEDAEEVTEVPDTSDLFETFPDDSGYVNVRENANVFWWLFFTKHANESANRPLIMWLQGGPGASSCGYGNFELIGPVGLDLQIRQHSWVNEASVLFVDNPVGAGYSFVSNDSAYTKNTAEVAEDLLIVFKDVLEKYPMFKTVPFHIFGQSYGGKFGAVFAERLHKAISDGEVESNLQGVAFGNAWISPLDSTLTYAPLLKYMSILDEGGHAQVEEAAEGCQRVVEDEDWAEAYRAWRRTTNLIEDISADISFYNILEYNLPPQEDRRNIKPRQRRDAALTSRSHDEFLLSDDMSVTPGIFHELNDIMDSDILRAHLNISDEVKFDGQRQYVFRNHREDFMKPVIDKVDNLLELGIQVTVYQGQLDLICANAGAVNWVNKLQWPGLPSFNAVSRVTMRDRVTGQPRAFLKSYENFNFFWILDAGHAVPKDQSAVARRVLRCILEGTDQC